MKFKRILKEESTQNKEEYIIVRNFYWPDRRTLEFSTLEDELLLQLSGESTEECYDLYEYLIQNGEWKENKNNPFKKSYYEKEMRVEELRSLMPQKHFEKLYHSI